MDSRTRVLRRPMRTAGISPTASNLHALLREMHSRSANSATVMSFSFGGAFCIICSTLFPLARHVIAPRRECGPIVSRLGFVFQMATRKHEKTLINRGFCCSTGNFWQLFGNSEIVFFGNAIRFFCRISAPAPAVGGACRAGIGCGPPSPWYATPDMWDPKARRPW